MRYAISVFITIILCIMFGYVWTMIANEMGLEKGLGLNVRSAVGLLAGVLIGWFLPDLLNKARR
jgi:hypothetical protein